MCEVGREGNLGGGCEGNENSEGEGFRFLEGDGISDTSRAYRLDRAIVGYGEREYTLDVYKIFKTCDTFGYRD